MRNDWIDDRMLDDEDRHSPRGRNPNSSVSAQYEDSLPPDPLADEADEADKKDQPS